MTFVYTPRSKCSDASNTESDGSTAPWKEDNCIESDSDNDVQPMYDHCLYENSAYENGNFKNPLAYDGHDIDIVSDLSDQRDPYDFTSSENDSVSEENEHKTYEDMMDDAYAENVGVAEIQVNGADENSDAVKQISELYARHVFEDDEEKQPIGFRIPKYNEESTINMNKRWYYFVVFYRLPFSDTQRDELGHECDGSFFDHSNKDRKPYFLNKKTLLDILNYVILCNIK